MRKSPPVLPYLLVAPTFLFVCTFTIIPLASAILGSLFRYQLNIPRFQIPQWHGLGNYIRLFSDEGFRGIIGNTVLYVLVLVPATIIAALALSLLVVSLVEPPKGLSTGTIYFIFRTAKIC